MRRKLKLDSQMIRHLRTLELRDVVGGVVIDTWTNPIPDSFKPCWPDTPPR